MNSVTHYWELKRSNTAASDDTFRAFAFPVPAVNPKTNKLGDLYMAYADLGTNANDKSDVFFTFSTNHGTNWTTPERINLDSTTNDQWMPVLCVKPEGTQLLLAWYDRRNDTNNSLIDLYGRFAAITTNGDLTFGSEFKITTTNFPPVFAGTLTSNTIQGHYDPVYPPEGVNLSWHYAEYPDDPAVVTSSPYRSHVGEYNGAWADAQGVYVSWTDYRLQSIGTIYGRHQSDVRFVRLTWPQ